MEKLAKMEQKNRKVFSRTHLQEGQKGRRADDIWTVKERKHREEEQYRVVGQEARAKRQEGVMREGHRAGG